jgi:UDP-N-acetyl-D-mannosaminuronic acid dehydrogenase
MTAETTEPSRSLLERIESRDLRVGVVGLGYVGLPVACAFADAGFDVVGVDVDGDRVAEINSGVTPIGGAEPGLAELLAAVVRSGKLVATTDHAELGNADIVTLNVQTPVGEDNRPSYTALEAACTAIAPVLETGAVVIVESTVSPGTTVGLVTPILEKGSGGREGVDFHVGACPERVMPGRLLENIRTVARVCGAERSEIAELMRSFYRTVVGAEIDVTTTTTAELVKVTENAYRDVQIAFANEVATICEDLGIDVWEVRDLVNKVPFRDMHRPGGGVGGHCIPKDPWLLAAAAKSAEPRLIPAARAINDGMPLHVAEVVEDALRAHRRERGLPLDAPARVSVLGVSYLAGSDDTRNSPSLDLIDELTKRGHEVRSHDPHVPGHGGPVADVLDRAEAVVLMVHHSEYADVRPDSPVFVDAERLGEARASSSGPVS